MSIEFGSSDTPDEAPHPERGHKLFIGGSLGDDCQPPATPLVPPSLRGSREPVAGDSDAGAEDDTDRDWGAGPAPVAGMRSTQCPSDRTEIVSPERPSLNSDAKAGPAPQIAKALPSDLVELRKLAESLGADPTKVAKLHDFIESAQNIPEAARITSNLLAEKGGAVRETIGHDPRIAELQANVTDLQAKLTALQEQLEAQSHVHDVLLSARQTPQSDLKSRALDTAVVTLGTAGVATPIASEIFNKDIPQEMAISALEVAVSGGTLLLIRAAFAFVQHLGDKQPSGETKEMSSAHIEDAIEVTRIAQQARDHTRNFSAIRPPEKEAHREYQDAPNSERGQIAAESITTRRRTPRETIYLGGLPDAESVTRTTRHRDHTDIDEIEPRETIHLGIGSAHEVELQAGTGQEDLISDIELQAGAGEGGMVAPADLKSVRRTTRHRDHWGIDEIEYDR